MCVGVCLRMCACVCLLNGSIRSESSCELKKKSSFPLSTPATPLSTHPCTVVMTFFDEILSFTPKKKCEGTIARQTSPPACSCWLLFIWPVLAMFRAADILHTKKSKTPRVSADVLEAAFRRSTASELSRHLLVTNNVGVVQGIHTVEAFARTLCGDPKLP